MGRVSYNQRALAQKLIMLVSALFISSAAWCADGDVFTVKTIEGVEVTYQIVSEDKRTCQVGYYYEKKQGVRCAVDVTTTGAITIPAQVNGYSVRYIAQYAFSSCSNITSIYIPDGVVSIGNGAFNSCENAITIRIPNSVTGDSFGERTFAGCKSLTSINIPEGITTIGIFTFYQCSQLEEISFPSTLTVIKNDAFLECTGLKSLVFPASLVSIQARAFSGCTSVSSVSLPDSLKTIGSDAFSGCSFTSISLPSTFSSVGYSYGIGYYINTLKKVVINKGVSNLFYVFRNCGFIRTVICYNEEPVSAYYCWVGSQQYATLYVPKGSKEAYLAHEDWKGFKEIVEMDGDMSDIGDVFAYNGINYVVTNSNPAEVEVGINNYWDAGYTCLTKNSFRKDGIFGPSFHYL